MAAYGYARVSSTDQDCALQEAALRKAGCDAIRSERKTGTTLAGRSELATLLEFLRPGDTLVVTRIDRLARSVLDLETIVRRLGEIGAHLRAIDQPIDTATPAGRAFLQMLGVFAEFETAIRKERQMEGIARAKAGGRYRGGKRRIDHATARALFEEGLSAREMGRRLGCTRVHASRLRKWFAAEEG